MNRPLHGLPALVALSVALAGTATTARAQKFVDVAPQNGIAGWAGASGTGIGGGASWADVDGDTFPDLIVTGPTLPPRLYRQTGEGFVEDGFALVPDTPPGSPGGHLTFDMEGDGDPDVLLLRPGRNALLRNDGGTFVDVSESTLPGTALWSLSAAAGDFDGDGDDDLLIANYINGVSFPDHDCARNSLLVNDGHGRFSDMAEEYGLLQAGCTLAVAMTDYDGDGDLDLAIVNDFGHFSHPNELHRNDGPAPGGGWTFTDVSVESGFDVVVYGMGIASNDIDDDGVLDYAVTSIGAGRLLVGGQDGVFSDQTTKYGYDVTLAYDGWQVTWGVTLEDLDADGWVDLFAPGGHIAAAPFIGNDKYARNLLLAGGPAPPWEEKPSDWSIYEPQKNTGRGVAVGDFDQDGRQDLAVAHANGLLSVYQNVLTAGLTLRIRPRPSMTGPGGAGTRVTASCGAMTRMRELMAGGSFAGGQAETIQVTFPEPCQATGAPVDLTLRWPSGYVQTMSTTTGWYLEPEEPEWIVVTDEAVTIWPTGADGQPLPPEADVIIGSEGALLGPTTTTDDGGWTAAFIGPEPGDTARLTIGVNGAALPVHPSHRWLADQSVVRHALPEHAIVDRALTLIVSPRGPDGLPIPPAVVEVVLDAGEVHLAEPLGDGDYRVTLAEPGDTGTHTAEVRVGGVLWGEPWTFDVEPPFDPSQSRLKYGHLYVPEELVEVEDFHIFLLVRDRNGEKVDTALLTFTILVDGQATPPEAVNTNDSEALLSFPPQTVPDGSTVQVLIDGVAFRAPETMYVVDGEAGMLPFIDPDVSHCGASMSAMYANGADRLTVMLFLRDENRNPVPPVLPYASPILDGLTLVSESVIANEERQQFVVQAGQQPMTATIRAAVAGTDVGLECRVDLWGAKPLPTAMSKNATTFGAVPDKLPIGGSVNSALTFTPRGADGRLVGGGLSVALQATLGELAGPFEYNGLGKYRATLLPGLEPGVAVATATVSEPAYSMDVAITIFDPNPPPDPEPVPEPVPEPAPDVSEPVPDVPEPVPDNVGPGPDNAEPVPDVAEPVPDVAEPVPDVAEPEPDNVGPGPDNAEPVPDVPEPTPDNVGPGPDNAEPVPDVPEPAPDNVGPGPDNAEPVPDVPEPVPDNVGPGPDNAEPVPDVAEPAPDNVGPGPDNAEPMPDLAEPAPDEGLPVPDVAEPTDDPGPDVGSRGGADGGPTPSPDVSTRAGSPPPSDGGCAAAQGPGSGDGALWLLTLLLALGWLRLRRTRAI